MNNIVDQNAVAYLFYNDDGTPRIIHSTDSYFSPILIEKGFKYDCLGVIKDAKEDSYRLFIDDERFPVDPDWFVARNSYQAVKAIQLYGLPREIAFDHDLGGDDTAMVFINWLTNYMMDNDLKFPKDFVYSVHSQNPIGVENINARMEKMIEFFGKNA